MTLSDQEKNVIFQPYGIIIANGEPCSEELLRDCLGKATIVVVLDAAIERVLALGIRPTVLLGDFDRDFDHSFYKENDPDLEVVHIINQNKTDLEKALDFLLQRKILHVDVLWATGRRSDHHFSNISCLVNYRNSLKITLLDDYSKIYLLDSKYSKWFAADTIISLIPLGKVTGVITQNLFYSLENEDLYTGYRMGNSNHVLQDGTVTIEHETGDLLLMECKD
jgi:thiamine pyrophosphokinase